MTWHERANTITPRTGLLIDGRFRSATESFEVIAPRNGKLVTEIAFANAHDLKSPIETLALSQAQEAHDRLRRGTVAGRVVLVPDALVSSSFSRLLD